MARKDERGKSDLLPSVRRWHPSFSCMTVLTLCSLMLKDVDSFGLVHHRSCRLKRNKFTHLNLFALFGDRSRSDRSSASKEAVSTDDASTAQGTPSEPALEWQVFVDQSKSALDKGASATLDAFIGLAPSSLVQVQPAILQKAPKAKGPLVRCLAMDPKRDSLEVANVDSVDKVYRILTKHMKVTGIRTEACDCLKWKYKGNGHLEAGNVALAIDAYDNALATGVVQQEGIVLLMRATAYFERAKIHKKQLKESVNDLIDMVPDMSSLKAVFEETSTEPALVNSVFRRVLEDTSAQEKEFRRTQYRHGLYQYTLLQAAQDSLRATQLLPKYATSWLRAGEILSDLWKLKESAQYYERAMQLDTSLTESVMPIVERLRKRQELVDNARAYGWSEDTLRLALDVAG